jgi:hypothetical protein
MKSFQSGQSTDDILTNKNVFHFVFSNLWFDSAFMGSLLNVKAMIEVVVLCIQIL